MSHYSIILNPVAGKGESLKILPRVEEAFRSRALSYDLHTTTAPGEATRLARQASGDIVVALGGDGTVNETANGVIGSGKTLGVIPAGSGNDFIKAAKIPRKLPSALETLFAGHASAFDVGYVETSDGKGGGTARYFTNGVGIGFDAAVAVKTAELRFLTGIPLYLAAVFKTLGKFTPPHFAMEFDGEKRESTNLLIAIGNGPCAGGGFFLTPDAIPDDGLFDVLLVDAVSVPTILRLMPRVMLGKHRNAKEVKFLRAKRIHLNSQTEFYVHADGEIVGRSVNSVVVSMREKAISVIGGRA